MLKVHPGQSVCYPSARDIAALIAEHRIRAVHEFELQAGLERIFKAADYTFETHVLATRGDASIDFLLQGAHGPIGVICAVSGSVLAIDTRLYHCAHHETVRELMLVTTRRKHKSAAPALCSKAITVVYVGENE